jgi:hypothetical protein
MPFRREPRVPLHFFISFISVTFLTLRLTHVVAAAASMAYTGGVLALPSVFSCSGETLLLTRLIVSETGVHCSAACAVLAPRRPACQSGQRFGVKLAVAGCLWSVMGMACFVQLLCGMH